MLRPCSHVTKASVPRRPSSFWLGPERAERTAVVAGARARHRRAPTQAFLQIAPAAAPWHFLYFFPEPQGQGSLRPTFTSFLTVRPLAGSLDFGGALNSKRLTGAAWRRRSSAICS